MNIQNLIKVSIRAVFSNKMRSFLSMLGIIIGVAAVIAMMSIGQGSKESIRQEKGYYEINIQIGSYVLKKNINEFFEIYYLTNIS